MNASPVAEFMELLMILGLLTLPVGFLVSTVMAVLRTNGPRRKISILILGLVTLFLCLIFTVIAFDNQIHYRLENMLFGTAAVIATVAIFCAYLAHTYWPTKLRAVNLPATLGMGGICLTLVTMLLTQI
ncbi:hypothetical protein [Halocynthiibacter sp.]|uniref:hypothetical protein n=1 Tax=Halocynthiibacter sp. TaxID=1979210 RepID=UPI003C3DB614